MTIYELRRPLRFGDPEQIAAVHAYEAGALDCPACGRLFQPDRSGWQDTDGGYVPSRVTCTHCAAGVSVSEGWRRAETERLRTEMAEHERVGLPNSQ